MKHRTQQWVACIVLFTGVGVFVSGAIVENLLVAFGGIAVMAVATFGVSRA